jgi:hypothetical protein
VFGACFAKADFAFSVQSDGPTFHTSKKNNSSGWCYELAPHELDDDTGKGRLDKGRHPLQTAILDDLDTLASDENTTLLKEVSTLMSGITEKSEVDAEWVPFLIHIPNKFVDEPTSRILQLAIHAPTIGSVVASFPPPQIDLC